MWLLFIVAVVVKVKAQGGPVNDDEPTHWCFTCSIHDSMTSNNPYWSYFPNGDNVRFGLFKLGHRWVAGTYDAAWNSDFSMVRAAGFVQTPLNDDISQWAIANGFFIKPHLSELWSAMCPLDSDGDGFSNGVELGDPDCTFPGTPARSTDLSDPNDAGRVPPTTKTTTKTTPAPTTTTTSTTTTETTAITSTAPTTLSSTRTAEPTSQLMPSTQPTAVLPAATNRMHHPCDEWRQYSIVAGEYETTFTAAACVARGAADPHYETVSGAIITCDNLGWSTLIESSEAVVEVRHDAVGASTATAIAVVRYRWKSSNRTVEYDSMPDANTTSDEQLVANANGVTDINGRNYLEVQRVLTTFGTFLNVQTVFAEPTSGILVEGCPTGSPQYDTRHVAESSICSDIPDDFARYSCNADIQRIGSDDFLPMAKGSAAQRSEVLLIPKPANGTTRVTRPIDSNYQGQPGIGVYIAVGIAVVIAAIVAPLIVYSCKREMTNEAARDDGAVARAPQVIAASYIVGQASEHSASNEAT